MRPGSGVGPGPEGSWKPSIERAHQVDDLGIEPSADTSQLPARILAEDAV